MHLIIWRGSETSAEDAERVVEKAVARLAQRVEQGEALPDTYFYAARDIREEIVDPLVDSGDGRVIVTRNAYGALVLNAARAFFIDVDLPEPSAAANIKQLFKRWLGKGDAKTSDPAAPALTLLTAFLKERPEWAVRVYRTKSGLRYLVTHALFDPADRQTEQAMQALGADPQYMQLCRAQKCFRARLTPKPWRSGVPNPPVRHPWQNPSRNVEMQAWIARYEAANQPYATCSFLGAMGAPTVAAEVASVVTYHDEQTRASSALPLA